MDAQTRSSDATMERLCRMHRFLGELMGDARVIGARFDVGVAFIAAASRGAVARAVLEPGTSAERIAEIERAAAELEGAAHREAWLFGFRWRPVEERVRGESAPGERG